MKGHRALLGKLTVAAMALAPACRNTAEGVKEDSRQNAEKAREGAQEVKQASEDAAQAIGEKAQEVGDTVAKSAKGVSSKSWRRRGSPPVIRNQRHPASET